MHMSDNVFRDEQMNRPARRVPLFDTVRGLVILSMVAFHATYDAVILYGCDIEWFLNPLIQTVWRNSISWTFLLLAGIMCSYSRNNVKRAARYFLVALLIWIATSIAAVDIPISFGIIYCMGSSVALFAVLKPFLDRISSPIGFFLFTFLFLATLDKPHGVYGAHHLAWLGFPDANFESGDYYPIVPYSFLLLAGSFIGRSIRRHQRESSSANIFNVDIPVLRVIGKHPLGIYLIHQPLLLLFFDVWVRFI